MYTISRLGVRHAQRLWRQKHLTSRLKISSTWAASAGLAAGTFILLPDPSYDFKSRDWHQSALSANDGDKSGRSNVSSITDIPKLVGESASRVYTQTRHWILKQFDKEGDKTIAALTAVNVSIYLLWKSAPTSFMVRHFANSLEAVRNGRVWTSVTSNFSHFGIIHLGANMYLLNRFGPEVVDVLGKERFYVFYVVTGIASSLASLSFRKLTKSNILSLGASGAVVGVLWLYACFFPDRRMSILGSEKALTMQELAMAYMVIDAAGLLGSLGKIDFAAHLGGAVFANFWFYVIRDKLVREQEIRRKHQNQGAFFRNFARSEAQSKPYK